MNKILAVIPARGGSRGVPRKNVRLLNGKPLIAYTIEAALNARRFLSSVLVSTDDEEIAEVARRYGAEVPFLRPSELATDSCPTLPVIQHAVSFVENRDRVTMDWVMILQPTAPFREASDIIEAVTLAEREKTDSVISVVQVFSEHPILMKKIENGRLLPFCIEEHEGTRRQDYSPAAYMRNGAIYLSRRDVLIERHSIWGTTICPYVMPAERSINIDSELQFQFAEALLRQRSL